MAKKNNGPDGAPPSKWGKGKTDPATWWEKGGPSPNPKGRPKGSKNQKTIYQEAFNKKIKVVIDGEEVTMPKKEVTYHQIANQAAGGDPKARLIQLELDAKFDPPETAPPTKEESEADYQTLDLWIALREKFAVFKPQENVNANDSEDQNQFDGEDDDAA